ncbi:HD domain-containing protein [Thalassococcus lentus]|uniref:HD domain-containing protein n=1 Tax=Thalassococcus lentus TaxID=1210524 RepID=A0ABT4XVI8_9RHOB|nr:HD domain-containing protein [Thalassococcus lentus]MDA7425985.1 HD domain-containing protein [Thalassococcus lentus]
MTSPITPRLDAQMAFLYEACKLKSVSRATRISTGDRFENSAEHSWHIALYALTLAEHAPEPVEIGTVIKMLLLHDLVEIDAGDAPVFGDHDVAAIEQAEQAAATRIFGLLPEDQAKAFRQLWDEFEANETPEARFAKSLDRFAPPNLNLAAGGGSWTDYGVTIETFETRVAPKIASGAPALWEWLKPKARALLSRLAGDNPTI